MAYSDRNNDTWLITPEMNAGRIVAKGEITVANASFSLTGNVPYSLFLLPNPATSDVWQIISVQLQQDLDFSDLPYNIGCWTESSVWKANITSGLLVKYRIFWGSGTSVEGGV